MNAAAEILNFSGTISRTSNEPFSGTAAATGATQSASTASGRVSLPRRPLRTLYGSPWAVEWRHNG